ncbi:equilibrative nucleotide transporter 1-like [Olea europaea var. sylvestris]|uniref:equilibrative nucleotide transporter 1-like n=1 Tax=Olea europaea var. sylvestris TaxID=158386 RepID=UPI000C1CFB0C|nr:equilibrative nucleotide transporter 1-like [Olea europaea var. sylvestris]
MGIATTSAAAVADGDSESATLLIPKTSSTNPQKIPKDNFNMAYIIYFTLGAGYLLPWNAFITAVDYFSYIYPDVSVDRVFAVVYMLIGLMSLLFIVAFAHKSNSFVRINVGMVLFVIALLTVPLMDVWYIKGRVGVYVGYYVTVAVLGLCGVADGLVQGSVVGNAGELPERYMQAVVAGTAASGKFYGFLVILGDHPYLLVFMGVAICGLTDLILVKNMKKLGFFALKCCFYLLLQFFFPFLLFFLVQMVFYPLAAGVDFLLPNWFSWLLVLAVRWDLN